MLGMIIQLLNYESLPLEAGPNQLPKQTKEPPYIFYLSLSSDALHLWFNLLFEITYKFTDQHAQPALSPCLPALRNVFGPSALNALLWPCFGLQTLVESPCTTA